MGVLEGSTSEVFPLVSFARAQDPFSRASLSMERQPRHSCASCWAMVLAGVVTSSGSHESSNVRQVVQMSVVPSCC